MTTLSSEKAEKLEACRTEAIDLLNQGYLAKAIIHLEKGLGNQTPEQSNAAFRLIKNKALGGEFESKDEFINLINLIK